MSNAMTKANEAALGRLAAMSKPQQKEVAADGAIAYEPTPQECEAMETFVARRGEAMQTPHLKVMIKTGGVEQIALDHPDINIASVLLMNATGTTNVEFLDEMLGQLANVASKGGPEISESKLNFMLSVIKGIEPKDQLEAMLAAQMAGVHMATMDFAQRPAWAPNIPQRDRAERAFNKLARTFTTQMEALKRYRTGGQQRVIVEHVTVNEGGQAIVGSVSRGGGAIRKSEERPHARSITHAPGEALPSDLKTVPETVPSARR